ISFFSSRRRHTSFSRDWSSDVCSSDLAGIGILEQASPMIQDFFSSVTPQAAAGFVGLLSLANLVGRFGWSTASDKLGRKRAYMLYLGTGALLYSGVATIGGSSIAIFVSLTFVILTFYGGGFATI